MEDTVIDFLCPPFIPEIFAQVAAGPADNRQFVAVLIMTARAFPLVVVVEDDFAVKTAFVAVVELGIEFAVGNMVVNILDHGKNSRGYYGPYWGFRRS